MRRLSDAATYFKNLIPIEDETLNSRAELLFNRFKDYLVPLVTLGDMTIKDVGPVFERINSTGTRLTIFDLMRAATWSPNFDLGKTVSGIKQAIEPKKFDNFDDKTFLRALGAAGGSDFSAESIETLRNLKEEELAIAAENTRRAALHAADFLATEVGVPRAEALPYANQFAVLCEIFRLVPEPNATQLKDIVQWFWGSTLSNYFGGWNNGQMGSDARAVRKWAKDGSGGLNIVFVMPASNIWRAKAFRSNSAVSKMLGLMLSHSNPVDLLNGQKIDVDKSLAWANDKEYHHFFPQNYMNTKQPNADDPNLVGNIILLTSKSNIAIRDKAPSEYLGSLIKDQGRDVVVQRLASCLIPEAALDAALADDYAQFLAIRSEYLQKKGLELAGEAESARSNVDANEVDDSDDDTTE